MKYKKRLVSILTGVILLFPILVIVFSRKSDPIDFKQNPVKIINSFYNVDALQKLGYTGNGAHVAIVSLAPLEIKYVEDFCKYYDISKPNIKIISVSDPAETSSIFKHEIIMDVDYVHATAPDAILDVYVGSDLLNVLRKIDKDNIADIVTTSWGHVYSAYDATASQTKETETEFTNLTNEMVKKGMTIFAITGDSPGNTSNAYLLYPSILPNVVAVSGTSVNLDKTRKKITETDSNYFTGGWTPFSRPSYQDLVKDSPSIPKKAKDYRMIPDISGVGDMPLLVSNNIQDNVLGVEIMNPDDTTGVYWARAWGTSLAAPYVAGIFADISGGLHKRLGDIHSTLYSAESSDAFHKPNSISSTNFKGGNPFNLNSGLGSIDAVKTAKLFGLK